MENRNTGMLSLGGVAVGALGMFCTFLVYYNTNVSAHLDPEIREAAKTGSVTADQVCGIHERISTNLNAYFKAQAEGKSISPTLTITKADCMRIMGGKFADVAANEALQDARLHAFANDPVCQEMQAFVAEKHPSYRGTYQDCELYADIMEKKLTVPAVPGMR